MLFGPWRCRGVLERKGAEFLEVLANEQIFYACFSPVTWKDKGLMGFVGFSKTIISLAEKHKVCELTFVDTKKCFRTFLDCDFHFF